MVDLMTAYQVLNKSILKVVDEVNGLDVLEFDNDPYQVRLEETAIQVSDMNNQVVKSVVVGHNLSQYVNKFYSIYLDSNEVVAIDYLININREDIDLTEFGEYL